MSTQTHPAGRRVLDRRACGVLLHPTSLPGPHGIGTIGAPARHFLRELRAMKQSFWQILPTGPTGDFETASLFFVSALSAAQKRIWLSAAYFVPDDAVMKALQLAALRGVDVRIITTGKPDSLPVYLAAFHYIERLRGLGIRFYAYTPGFMHQKVMLVDDFVSSVGTHNFDNRSFRLNFEVSAVIVDPDFAAEMEAMFEADFQHAVPIDPEALEQKPLWWRAGVQLSRLAAPVL